MTGGGPGDGRLWWWVRHAPVVGKPGRFCGRSDLPADLSDRGALRAAAGRLPSRARLLVSPLQRARQTADALTGLGFAPDRRETEPGFAEQDFGAWEGRGYDALWRSDEAYRRFWDDPAHGRPPGGESFADLAGRVERAVARRDRREAPETVVVAHAGTLRAVLAGAEGGTLAGALGADVPFLGVLVVERLPSAKRARWRIVSTVGVGVPASDEETSPAAVTLRRPSGRR